MSTLRLLSMLSVAATAAAGCERSSKYNEPPATSYSVARFTLGTEPADTVTGAMVSPEFFAASNVRPLLGRFFLPIEYESAAQPVVVISDDLWRRRFKAAPQLIGTRIPLNEQPVFVWELDHRGSGGRPTLQSGYRAFQGSDALAAKCQSARGW